MANNSVGLTPPTFAFAPQHKVLIIGAGLAGCAIAHVLAQRGYRCKIFDRLPQVALGTSALPVAAVKPAHSGDALHTEYFNRAFEHCCTQLSHKLFVQCGSLQLQNKEQVNSAVAPSSQHEQALDAAEASCIAGTQINSNALYNRQAGYLHPQTLCRHFTDHRAIEFVGTTDITGLRVTDTGWQLLCDTQVVEESPVVILANASKVASFDLSRHLPLSLTSGQIDLFACNSTRPNTMINADRYLIPTSEGIWAGATYHRTENSGPITAADTQKNFASAIWLAPELNLHPKALASFAGIRCHTPDRLPVIGALPDAAAYQRDYADLKHGKPESKFAPPQYHQGLYALTGFGSHGSVQALFAATLLADVVGGKTTHSHLLKALHPARFLLRQLRKGQL